MSHDPSSARDVGRDEPRPIPREAWPLHPHWPDQVLLVRSHESFRAVSRSLCEVVRVNTDDSTRVNTDDSARLFRRWMYAMGSHEHYEETKLYPYLERRWGVSMQPLEAGHEAMHAQRDVVYAAFDALTNRRAEGADNTKNAHDARARARLRRELEAFDQLLLDHLDLEERTVVPLLLELTPTEFAEYTSLPIDLLLKRLHFLRGRSMP